MEVRNTTIKNNEVENIAANRDEFQSIFEDMRKSGGSFTPTPTWLLCKHPNEIEIDDHSEIMDLAASDEVFNNEFANLEQRLEGWIGGITSKSIDEPSVSYLVERYERFLNRRDPLGLWKANIAEKRSQVPLRIADLGSLMDLTMIYSYASNPARKVTTILEVGGGYGRLAEAALNVFGTSIRYVMIDSVPVSLYYSKKYLERACPDVRIGSYYNGDPFDLDEFTCYILPAWYFEQLNKAQYDVCINIESFQEMNQGHIDTYLQIFDRVSVDDATIYLDNAHDYIFRGDWNYPRHWRELFCSNTPRSWSDDHPAQVFMKSKGDFSSQNAILEDLHYYMQHKAEVEMTFGDQVEALAGKRVRTVLSRGSSYIKGAFRSR